MKTLAHLQANDWISIRRKGSEIELRLGKRGRRVMDAIPKAKRKEAA